MNDAFDSAPETAQQAPQVDLSGLDNEYEQAKAASMDDVPDGKYQAVIHGVRLNKSKKGDPMLQYDLIVISGPHEGRHIFKNSMMTAAAMPFFKAEMNLLGVVLPRLSELGNHLGEMLDKTLDVTKKTKEERSSVYFNKLLNIPAGAATGDAPASNGPIPF